MSTAGIRLLIEEEQLDWREEDAPLRVAHHRTSVLSCLVGSDVGTHTHRDGLTVPLPSRLTWLKWNLPLDASKAYSWSVLWGAEGTVIGGKGRVATRSAWAPLYPVRLMIDEFEIGARSILEDAHPKSTMISWVRGWQL